MPLIADGNGSSSIAIAREDGDRRAQALAALFPAEPYLDYANFPPIARGGGTVALHARWWRGASEVLVARDGAGHPLAALRFAPRDFESSFFGIPMAKIDAPLAVADEARRVPALRALYAALLASLGADGFQHAAAAGSTHDRVASWVLQELGGFHVGTRISWLAPLTGVGPEPVLPPGLRLEILDRAAIPTLPRRAWQRLHEWTRDAFDRGPFVFDLTVPSQRAAELYQAWTEKALTGEWADVLLLIRDARDEVVAFNAMLLLPELSDAAGAGVLGRGIGATLPDHRGLFTALQHASAYHRPLGAGWLENETQSATLATINVFGRLGHRCFRSTNTLHFPLDASGPVRSR